jgi:hypothetical protein
MAESNIINNLSTSDVIYSFIQSNMIHIKSIYQRHESEIAPNDSPSWGTGLIIVELRRDPAFEVLVNYIPYEFLDDGDIDAMTREKLIRNKQDNKELMYILTNNDDGDFLLEIPLKDINMPSENIIDIKSDEEDND